MIEIREFLDLLPFLRNALIAGVVIGGLAPLIGGYFVLRRTVLLGIAIPQVSSAGIAFTLMVQGLGLFGLSGGHVHGAQPLVLVGALAFTLIGVIVLGTLAHRNPGLADISIGFTFALSSALSLLFLAHSPVAEASMLNLLKGEIIAATDRDVLRTSVLSVLLVASLIFFHKEFLLVSYDREFAISMGKRVAAYDVLFYVVAGVAVSLSVMTVGSLTTFGYLILPPMIALLFTRGMARFFVASAVIGGVSSAVGLAIAFILDLPAGPATVGVLVSAYMTCGILKRLLSLCRKRSRRTTDL